MPKVVFQLQSHFFYKQLFYKQQFYKQEQAEIGKKFSKSWAAPWDWAFDLKKIKRAKNIMSVLTH